MIDSAKADMMRKREGEMATEPQVKEKHVKTGAHSVGHLPTNHKRKASKTFQIHGCKDIATMGHRQTSYENTVDKSSRTLNKATPMEGSCTQAHTKNGSDCSCRSVGHQKCNQLSEINLQVKMNEVAEEFINQKFVEGKFLDKKKASHQSKHFLDALEILNSNKELFISLLQDPSSLLVKHIQDLRQSQEHGCNKNSSDRDSTKGSFDPQTAERIVALKPGSSAGGTSDCSSQGSLYSLRNRVQSDIPTYFSFGHIKRRLRRAIGLNRKEKSTSTDFMQHKSPCDIQGLGDGKGKGSEIGENNSLSEYKLGTCEVAKCSSVKRKDKLGNVRDSESGIKEQVAFNDGSDYGNSTFSVVGHRKQSEYNVHLEASKCLSEVLRNRNVDSSKKQVPINSRRIVSLPEYDFFSARSLERHQDHGFNAAQMRFSPYSYYQMVNEKKQQLQREKINGYFSPVRQITEVPSLADYKRFTDQLQIFDTKPNDSGKNFSNIKGHESVCSLSDTSSSRGSVYNTVNRGEISTLSMPLEPPNLHNNDGNQNTIPANTYEDNEHLECSKLDSPQECCVSPSSEDAYSSSSLSIKTLEDSDGMKDKAEYASPVSVLDPYFLQDITSPLTTICQSAEPAVEPKQENYEHYSALVTSFQDMKINSSKAMNEHDSMSKCITTLLQASGIKWEELPMKCHSSAQLLEPSLLDELELLPNQITVDQKLLFDYINEVLLEIYRCYFCCAPWVSFLKPKVQPIHYGVNLVNEVMKCIDLDILFHQQFQTLDQLVEKDLAKSRTWMNIQIDTEVTVTEVVESVLEVLALEIFN